MAFKSGMWTSNGVGDGPEAGYDQDWVRGTWHALFASGVADAGVVADYEDALLVTTTAETYTVATGFACVYGFFFENTASYDFEVVTPVGGTRIDRIVVRADWAAQTVELAVVTGTPGGAAPSLTQTASTTWEIPLSQASVTTGGAITLTDQREYLGASTGTAETSAATPATLVLRDANARAKMGAPSAATDIAILSTVTDHAALTTAHGAVSAPTASKIIVRDASGRAQVAAPSAAADIARLDTISDLLGAYTTSATGSTTTGVNSGRLTILTQSGIVTTRTCDLLVQASARMNGTSTGSTMYGLVKFYGATNIDGETYAIASVNGTSVTLSFHTVFEDVVAGTYSITLELWTDGATGTTTSRRITVQAIPTGA